MTDAELCRARLALASMLAMHPEEVDAMVTVAAPAVDEMARTHAISVDEAWARFYGLALEDFQEHPADRARREFHVALLDLRNAIADALGDLLRVSRR